VDRDQFPEEDRHVTERPVTSTQPSQAQDTELPQAERLYRSTRLIRRFEERAIELVRSGEIASGIHPCIGQEAVAVGVCAALAPDDAVFTHHRNHGHMLAKGTEPRRLLAELYGAETGVARGRGGSFHPSDASVGVFVSSGTLGHATASAVGVAWSAAELGTGQVVVSFFGDGAMNQGALLEAFNMAALWRLPVVFVCESNGYATTVPTATTHAGSIAGRGAAFGIPVLAGDGMDPEAVLRLAGTAVAKARSGEGPVLLELTTYRFEAHHTFEYRVRLRYRDEAEIASWRLRDPVETQGGRITADQRLRLDEQIERQLDEAVHFARTSPRPDPAGALDHRYANQVKIRPGVPVSLQ
jgi:TPP-dependent pyruvate/acetoin dehydrogenase alpha subunit